MYDFVYDFVDCNMLRNRTVDVVRRPRRPAGSSLRSAALSRVGGIGEYSCNRMLNMPNWLQ